tara:strand:+ start:210813 stop:211595 length:783 start_codon:yes stop_codon:yes gene_type:complete
MEDITIDMILSAFLIFTRVAAVFMTAPFFNNGAFPRQIKLYAAVVTTVMLFNVIPSQGAFISADSGTMFVITAVITEILVGAAMGLIGQLIFAGLELAGSLISMQTALSFANMVDSTTQKQNMVVGNILNMLAVMVFLMLDGDKIYLSAIAKSYQLIPATEASLHLAGPYMLEAATYLFIVGVQITSPFLMVIFILDLALAIFARIMPQANMMFIAMPFKFGVGIAVLMMVLPYLPTGFEILFQNMFNYLGELLGEMMPV